MGKRAQLGNRTNDIGCVLVLGEYSPTSKPLLLMPNKLVGPFRMSKVTYPVPL
jgi:hypothetical protein